MSHQGDLFEGKAPDLPARQVQPRALEFVASISVAGSLKNLVELLRKVRIEAFVDTRLNPSYRAQGIQTNQDDLRYLLESLLGIQYFHILDLAPNKELRDALRADQPNREYAWTAFLRGYGDLMRQRKPLQSGQFADLIIDGTFKRIAVACSCRHHGDCHRQYTVGMIGRWVAGVQIEHLQPDGKVPRKSPRRYLREDIPEARLTREFPRGRRRS